MSDLGMSPGPVQSNGFSLKDLLDTPDPTAVPGIGEAPPEPLFGTDSGRAQAAALQQAMQQNPNVPMPTINPVITAPDLGAAAAHLTGATDPIHVGKVAGLMSQYANGLAETVPDGATAGAQFDFAKLDGLIKSGKLDDPQVVAGYKTLRDGGDLPPDQLTEVMSKLRAVADATDNILSPDLHFDENATVARVTIQADGPVVDVSTPLSAPPSARIAAGLSGTPTHLPDVPTATQAGLLALSDGSVVPYGPASPKMALLARHLYPAIISEDGTALYGKGGPRGVRDLDAHIAKLSRTVEGHQVETWSADAFEGLHPAERGITSLMVDLPAASGAASRAAQMKLLTEHGSVRDPGQPVSVETTVRSRARLQAADIALADLSDKESSPLLTTDWATVPAAAAGRLRGDGFEPIPAGNGRVLAFGLGAAKASQLGLDYGASQVTTNDGIWNVDDGTLAPFDPDQLSIGTHNGSAFQATVNGVQFSASTVGEPEELDPAEVASRRSTRTVRRMSVELPGETASTASEVADKLEQAGAKVSAIYSPFAPSGGWKKVRDHVYTDGVTTSLVRTTDPEVEAPHGFTGWVRTRDADGLPKANPEGQRVRTANAMSVRSDGTVVVDGQAVLAPGGPIRTPDDLLKVRKDGEAPTGLNVDTSGPVPHISPSYGAPGNVMIVGGKLQIPADGADLTPVAAIANALGVAGFNLQGLTMKVGSKVRPVLRG